MPALAMTETPARDRVRAERKALLDELRHADNKQAALNRCAELLLACDEALDSMSVYDLVRTCYHVGRARAKDLLAHAEVDLNIRVGEILIRDAQRLAAVLRGGR